MKHLRRLCPVSDKAHVVGYMQVSVASKEVAGAMGYIAQNRTIWFKDLSHMLSTDPNDMLAQRRREQVEVHLNGGQER